MKSLQNLNEHKNTLNAKFENEKKVFNSISKVKAKYRYAKK